MKMQAEAQGMKETLEKQAEGFAKNRHGGRR